MTSTLSDAIDAFSDRFGAPVDRSVTGAVWEYAMGTIALREYANVVTVESTLNRCMFSENLANTTLAAAMRDAATWCDGSGE